MDANAVAERYYGALRKNDLEGVIGTLDPGCRAEVPGATLDGAEQVRGWMGSFFDAFPDIAHSTGELDVAGQTVSADVHVTGTQTETMVTPQGTIPPTGRTIDLAARNVANRRYRDFLSRYKEFALNPGRNITLRVATAW